MSKHEQPEPEPEPEERVVLPQFPPRMVRPELFNPVRCHPGSDPESHG